MSNFYNTLLTEPTLSQHKNDYVQAQTKSICRVLNFQIFDIIRTFMANASDTFSRMTLHELYLDENGNCMQDLYVYMPAADRYICFIKSGDELEERKITALYGHSDPHLYAKRSETSERQSSGDAAEAASPSPDDSVTLDDLKKLREPIRQDLVKIFKNLAGESNDSAMTLAGDEVENLSNKFLEVISPDVNHLRHQLVENAKYMHIMDASASILCLSILFTSAMGFTARSIFKDLSFAVILMDLPLSEFSEESIKQYYKERQKLTRDVIGKYEQHPKEAFTLVNARLKSVNDNIRQLILGHHELFNGRGYPGKVRSETLTTVVRILSLAVDVYEHIRKAKENSEELALTAALELMLEPGVEAHLRRHNKKLVSSVLDFVKSTAPVANSV